MTGRNIDMEPTSNQRYKWFTLVVVLVALTAAIVAGVLLTGREADNQDSEASAPAGQVTITAGTLSPSTIKVQKGQSVIWTNQDSQPHQVKTSQKDLEGFGSGNSLQQGESFSYVFDKAGTYYYYDEFSPATIKGEIVVED
jgi:plastocyanin